MTNYYYVDKDKSRKGPMSKEELFAHDITPDTLVWCKGMEKWERAKNIPDLADSFAEGSPSMHSSLSEIAKIKCPACGKQISDKAVACPHCGTDVQKALAENSENQMQQRKKHRRRILISIISVVFVAAISVLAYLYHIDALNSIPTRYREQSQQVIKECLSAIDKCDFSKGNINVGILKNRWLTNKQAKKLEELEKSVIELGLNRLENELVSASKKFATQISAKDIENLKQQILVMKNIQLDAAQTERLDLAANHFVNLVLAEIEKRIELHESDTEGIYSISTTEQFALELKSMELSDVQKSRLESDVQKVKAIKENRHKQSLMVIRDEYIRLLNDNTSDDFFYSLNPQPICKSNEFQSSRPERCLQAVGNGF